MNEYEWILLALCVWREARGESPEAKRGVAWSIRNRTLAPAWWNRKIPQDYAAVIALPWQYTSMTGGSDPNLIKWPMHDDPAWIESLAAAKDAIEGTGADPTNGSTHYFDDSLKYSPPAWAKTGSFKAKLGRLNFYTAL